MRTNCASRRHRGSQTWTPAGFTGDRARVWAAYALTASRIPFAVAFWATYGSVGWSVVWVSAAAISDALDGRVARRARRAAGVAEHTPSSGDWLDPAADKLFVVIALAAIVAHDRGTWPLVACLLAREWVTVPLTVAVAVARGFGRGPRLELRAHAIGKAATVAQFVAVVALVAPGSFAVAVRWPLAIAAGVLGLAAVADHVRRGRRDAAAEALGRTALAARPARERRARPPVPAAGDAIAPPTLQHELAPYFPALRAIRTRRALVASALWREIGGEVERLLDGVERVDRAGATPPSGTLRAVAWNVQRGTAFEALRDALVSDPELARADVLLLSEVDVGMGRSHNRDVPRELADALGMSYAFAVSYLALEDDHLENPDGRESTLALAGSAILSRAPIVRAVSADVPALRDKFESSEKRLGRKRAVVAELATASGPLAVAQAHLDSNASSAQRARQLAAVLEAADALGAPRLLLGGDLNTTTYDMSSPWRLARDLLHKLFVTGWDRTLDTYMTPDRRYELPVFELLAARGLAIEGFNDRAHGTLRYDFAEPYTIAKVREAVGGILTRWLIRRLRSRGGVVEARVDWFAGRGLEPMAASVVWPRPSGARASDHEPIVVDVAL